MCGEDYSLGASTRNRGKRPLGTGMDLGKLEAGDKGGRSEQRGVQRRPQSGQLVAVIAGMRLGDDGRAGWGRLRADRMMVDVPGRHRRRGRGLGVIVMNGTDGSRTGVRQTEGFAGIERGRPQGDGEGHDQRNQPSGNHFLRV